MNYRLSSAFFAVAAFLFSVSASAVPANPVVRFETVLGNVDVSLRNDAAPGTVTNFLRYVDEGKYNGSFIHRSMPGFIVQGGGYTWIDSAQTYATIQAYPPIANQYGLSNVRGTIAMAKLPNQPDSATSEWFFNLADNSSNLDAQNGGFTVFGSVIGAGMTVVDAIAALPTENQGGSFTDIPLRNHVLGQPVGTANLVLLGVYRAAMGTSGNYTVLRGPNRSAASVTAGTYVKVDNFSVAANPSPTDAPADVTFGEGFFNIAFSNVEVGDTVSMVLSLPPGQHPNTYYKYGPTPDNHTSHWYNFMWDGETGAIIGVNPSDVALVFVDGKRGDDDYTANGTITDVGAPGVGPVASSGGGGGATGLLSLFAGLLTVCWREIARRRQLQ